MAKIPIIEPNEGLLRAEKRPFGLFGSLKQLFLSRAQINARYFSVSKSMNSVFQGAWLINRSDDWCDAKDDVAVKDAEHYVRKKLDDSKYHSINRYIYRYFHEQLDGRDENMALSASRLRRALTEKSIAVSASRLSFMNGVISGGAHIYGNDDIVRLTKIFCGNDTVRARPQEYAVGPIVDVQLVTEMIFLRALDTSNLKYNEGLSRDDAASLKPSVVAFCLNSARGADSQWEYFVKTICEDSDSIDLNKADGGRKKIIFSLDAANDNDGVYDPYQDYTGCPAYHANVDGKNLMKTLVEEYWDTAVFALYGDAPEVAPHIEEARCPMHLGKT